MTNTNLDADALRIIRRLAAAEAAVAVPNARPGIAQKTQAQRAIEEAQDIKRAAWVAAVEDRRRRTQELETKLAPKRSKRDAELAKLDARISDNRRQLTDLLEERRVLSYKALS